MDSSGGFKLTFIFLAAVVVPAGGLALVSSGAIIRERRDLARRSAQEQARRLDELQRVLQARADEPIAAAREAIARLARSAPSPHALQRGLRTLAATEPALRAAILVDEGGPLARARTGSAEAPTTRNAIELDERFRTAEQLEHLAQAPGAAAAAYAAVEAQARDPRAVAEAVGARARLLPKTARHGTERAAEAYRQLIERWDGVADRDGAVLSLGARLELARFWRDAGAPEEEARALWDLGEAVARSIGSAPPPQLAFYRHEAIARLGSLAPARAASLSEMIGRHARTAADERRLADAAGRPEAAPALRAVLQGGRAERWVDLRLKGRASGESAILRLQVLALERGGAADTPGAHRVACLLAVDPSAVFRRYLVPAAKTRRAALGGGIEVVAPGGTPEPRAAAGAARRALQRAAGGVVIVATDGAWAAGDPFAGLSKNLRLWAIGVLLLGLTAGAFIMLRAVRKEMQAAKLKSDFVTTVTHELKTPLTSIGMFAETLLLGRVESDEERDECIEIIAKETERLSRLIQRVLTFSKIEAQRKRFQLKLEPLAELVDETLLLFQRQMRGGRPMRIEVQTVQDLGRVLLDRAAVEEVLLNLLHNAYKYGARPAPTSRSSQDPDLEPKDLPPVRIVVVLAKRRGWTEVQVRDWGLGIPWREQRRIFRKFYRANDVLTRDVEGSGIGLTLARSIARAHRGDITVRSKVGHGSTFSLWLRR